MTNKTGLLGTVQSLLAKMNDHLIRLTSILDLNPLDYHVWGAMLNKCQKYQPKPTNKAELKLVLETIWSELPQSAINKAIMAFRKRLQACINADGGHFEHLLC